MGRGRVFGHGLWEVVLSGCVSTCMGAGMGMYVPVHHVHVFAPVSVKSSQPQFGSWKVPASLCEARWVSEIEACLRWGVRGKLRV